MPIFATYPMVYPYIIERCITHGRYATHCMKDTFHDDQTLCNKAIINALIYFRTFICCYLPSNTIQADSCWYNNMLHVREMYNL